MRRARKKEKFPKTTRSSSKICIQPATSTKKSNLCSKYTHADSQPDSQTDTVE